MTDPTLISDLERATEGSRELSDRVLVALGWKHISTKSIHWWINAAGIECAPPDRPNPTVNLQDAVEMVPSIPGANSHGYDAAPDCVEAYVSRNSVPNGHWTCLGEAATPALSLCIALILAAQEK